MRKAIELGYCCINLSLKEFGVSTNRGMIKKTFETKGLPYVSELVQKNLTDLMQIMRWNHENNIRVYRMSSDLFPWMSEYEFHELPDCDKILLQLAEIGHFAKRNDIRLSFHPGQFNVLPSPRHDVYQRTINDLDKHAQIMDLMGLPQSHYYPINIHVGGSYGDKKATLIRFANRFSNLKPSTQRRLVVENDDKPSQYSVKDLLFLYNEIGTPITFDYLHHQFCTGDMSMEEALRTATATWGSIKPVTHFSSSRRLYEDNQVPARSHADYLYEKIPHCNIPQDIEVEAKAKDLAVIEYLANESSLLDLNTVSF